MTTAVRPSSDQTAAVRKRLRYPRYRPSGVEWLGDVPRHWRNSRIAEAVRTLNGFPFDSERFVLGEGTPLVRIRDLNAVETEVNYLGPINADAWIERGDIIVGMDGDFKVARWQGPPALLNQRMCCLRPRPAMDPGFIAHLLPLPLGLINEVAYSTTVKHLSSVDVRKIQFAAPPLEEQRAIAAFLDQKTMRIDALVAEQGRLINMLREARIGLITRAVTKGLSQNGVMVDTGDDLFPAIPEGWRLLQLRRLLSRVARPVRVEPETEYREIGTRSWGKGIFHKDAVSGGQLEDKNVFYVMPGDLILNVVFAWEGAVAIASDREAGMVASHRFPTFRPADDQADSDYLLMFLQSDQGRALMAVNSPGAAGRNRTIRLESFLRERIPVPPLENQREIVTSFRAQEKLLQAAEVKARALVDGLGELRTAFISAAVTGKIDVREQSVA